MTKRNRKPALQSNPYALHLEIKKLAETAVKLENELAAKTAAIKSMMIELRRERARNADLASRVPVNVARARVYGSAREERR